MNILKTIYIGAVIFITTICLGATTIFSFIKITDGKIILGILLFIFFGSLTTAGIEEIITTIKTWRENK